MSGPKNIKFVTTFLLLKAHEPCDPPSIADAGSQAGQAFNQVLRYVAGCSGFHSQFFGWPTQPDSADVNLNEFMASLLPNIMVFFVNWFDESAAEKFLLRASLKQAFQGFTTFFIVPEAATPESSNLTLSDAPLAFNIAWHQEKAIHVLDKTKTPLRLKLGPKCVLDEERENMDHGSDSRATGRLTGRDGSQVTVEIENILDPASSPSFLMRAADNELYLDLMRTRYCSRLKESLNQMIRSRRID